MKLSKFRVQNYKTIEDSGWIRCDDVTAFVGKNEAGKTSLLRALSKLKSTDGSQYDPIKEFPHGRYTDEFKSQDWPVVAAEFQLEAGETEELKETCARLGATKAVTITKHYSGKTTVGFNPACSPKGVSYRDWVQALKDIIRATERVIPPSPSGYTPE